MKSQHMVFKNCDSDLWTCSKLEAPTLQQLHRRWIMIGNFMIAIRKVSATGRCQDATIMDGVIIRSFLGER